MNKEFQVHLLNEQGIDKAAEIAMNFDRLLSWLKEGSGCLHGRELALATTKLEEACFFAKKAMAMNPENQRGE